MFASGKRPAGVVFGRLATKIASERSFGGSVHEKTGCALPTRAPGEGVTGLATASAITGATTAASTTMIVKRRRPTISSPTNAKSNRENPEIHTYRLRDDAPRARSGRR